MTFSIKAETLTDSDGWGTKENISFNENSLFIPLVFNADL